MNGKLELFQALSRKLKLVMGVQQSAYQGGFSSLHARLEQYNLEVVQILEIFHRFPHVAIRIKYTVRRIRVNCAKFGKGFKIATNEAYNVEIEIIVGGGGGGGRGRGAF